MQFRIYVGRCTKELTEDILRSYFSQFGVVTEVYVPNPFKACAFITFQEARVAKSLIDEEHVIEGIAVHTSTADQIIKRPHNPPPVQQPQPQQPPVYQPWSSRAGAPSFGAPTRSDFGRGVAGSSARSAGMSYKPSSSGYAGYGDEESNPIANLPPDMFNAIASAVISEVRKGGKG